MKFYLTCKVSSCLILITLRVYGDTSSHMFWEMLSHGQLGLTRTLLIKRLLKSDIPREDRGFTKMEELKILSYYCLCCPHVVVVVF